MLPEIIIIIIKKVVCKASGMMDLKRCSEAKRVSFQPSNQVISSFQ